MHTVLQTAGLLSEVLAGITKSTDSFALDHAVAQMRSRAPLALGGIIRHGAKRLGEKSIADIAPRVYGFGASLPADLTWGRLLAKAEAAYAGERMRGRTGHWSYDFNRQLGLAEIVVALRLRVRKEER